MKLYELIEKLNLYSDVEIVCENTESVVIKTMKTDQNKIQNKTNNNLLILGAGIYGLVAKEVAESMGCFDMIDFIDDNAKSTPNGVNVLGKFSDIDRLSKDYGNIFVAIGNSKYRFDYYKKIEEETTLNIATLISPYAYVSPSAQIMQGSIVEPMAVIHSESIISKGCIISAGAVINHTAKCCECVHVDCNATVAGSATVPVGVKVESGIFLRKQEIN